jgi:hypothetical protein
MMEVDLKAGDIFTWQNYPLYTDELKSQRWLLYLGNNTIQAMVYQITTTTQLQHYTEGGNRTKHNYFIIPVGIGGLVKESVLDLTKYFEQIPESLFNKFKADIKKTGSLNQEYINRFVKHLRTDRLIQNIIKKDIYGYLRDAGFKVA